MAGRNQDQDVESSVDCHDGQLYPVLYRVSDIEGTDVGHILEEVIR